MDWAHQYTSPIGARAEQGDDETQVSTDQIRTWRSIVTLIVFIITNCLVLFPFKIPVPIPRPLADGAHNLLIRLRIIPSRASQPTHIARRTQKNATSSSNSPARRQFLTYHFPVNLLTAPLAADLFLLAIGAIGRKEVKEGTLGGDNIDPLDIMIFFITLAYIAISIDASGLIRYLAFRVLQWGGKVGHRLFGYLYIFFFGIGSFIGNDPIILSGTAFLAYLTRVSSNIVHPRAWIHTQFAVANIASAILVSSNPTNLVLAGAFEITFIKYTANMIVPVIVTAIVLFPFLLYIVFHDEDLIPQTIEMHNLSDEARAKKPVNPNIPNARGRAEEEENNALAENGEQEKNLSLEEIMNPFLDKGGAAFGAVIMAATLVTVLALNAAVSASNRDHPIPVFYVTLPAAVIMFCWDMSFGWYHRHETREIAQRGRADLEAAELERAMREEEEAEAKAEEKRRADQHAREGLSPTHASGAILDSKQATNGDDTNAIPMKSLDPKDESTDPRPQHMLPPTVLISQEDNFKEGQNLGPGTQRPVDADRDLETSNEKRSSGLDASSPESEVEQAIPGRKTSMDETSSPTTLASLMSSSHRWAQETFPTPMAVLMHLPFALVPFAFTMFILVQALTTKGWVAVFAHGWDHWVKKTGTVGAVGGMGFLGVVLSNFAGTNIGTTILLSRVIQAWVAIHRQRAQDNPGLPSNPISERDFWATVYSMALGVNYGAFSTAFSASLAGLLWRDILARKHITVRGLEFARVNLPIIAISMVVGCVVLIGEVYITRSTTPYLAEER